jgi:hypothetical protein
MQFLIHVSNILILQKNKIEGNSSEESFQIYKDTYNINLYNPKVK